MVAAFHADPVYFVQSRRHRDGRWEEWRICSPHYSECAEARKQFKVAVEYGARYWPEEFRLVRCVFRYDRVPIKTELYANVGSDVKVLRRMAA